MRDEEIVDRWIEGWMVSCGSRLRDTERERDRQTANRQEDRWTDRLTSFVS